MQDQLQSLSKKVKENQKANRNFFIKLRKKTPKNLDAIMEKLHEDEFKKSDCLSVLIAAKPPVQFLQRKILNAFQNLLELKHVSLQIPISILTKIRIMS